MVSRVSSTVGCVFALAVVAGLMGCKGRLRLVEPACGLGETVVPLQGAAFGQIQREAREVDGFGRPLVVEVFNEDDERTLRTIAEYDAQGRIVVFETQSNQVRRDTTEYDMDGRRSILESFVDGVPLNRTEYDYSGYDDISGVIVEFCDGCRVAEVDGTNDELIETTFSEIGLILLEQRALPSMSVLRREVREYDGADRLERVTREAGAFLQTETYFYNSDNRIERIDIDRGSDGSVDEARRRFYDGNGRLVREESDTAPVPLDGAAEQAFIRGYDATGRLVLSETDSNGDGVADSRTRWIFDDDVRTETRELDTDADGTLESVDVRIFDADSGQLLEHTWDVAGPRHLLPVCGDPWGVDGIVDERTTYSYDDGRLVGSLTESHGLGASGEVCLALEDAPTDGPALDPSCLP